MYDMSGFQRDLLYIIAGMEDPYGLGIKETYQDEFDEEVNHGRLYPNLDELVDRGFVKKSPKDRRTNVYEATDLGMELLQDRRDWENDQVDLD